MAGDYKLWKGGCPPAEPLTWEKVLAAWEAAERLMRRPHTPPVRLVPYARYYAAQDAIAAGATPHEVELVLAGATLAQAREWLRDPKV